VVQVKRAGDVIPQIIGPVPAKRAAESVPVPVPTHCPECNTPVRVEEKDLFCDNELCPGRRLEAMVHFASRGAMDVDGLSYARIEQLVDAGLVRDVADLYELTATQIAELERFAEKSAAALVAAIEASKRQPLSRLLFGLGIRHVGQEAALALAQRFGTLEALAGSLDGGDAPPAPRDAIESVRGIGPAIADSVVEFFADAGVRAMLTRLKARGLRLDEPVSAPATGPLTGKTVVITGTLAGMSRDDAKRKVVAAGGKVTDSVSKKTDFLVYGADAGSKLEKARSLGVPQLTEVEFERLLAGEDPPK
jgi:DNA ligase (NAD+)